MPNLLIGFESDQIAFSPARVVAVCALGEAELDPRTGEVRKGLEGKQTRVDLDTGAWLYLSTRWDEVLDALAALTER